MTLAQHEREGDRPERRRPRAVGDRLRVVDASEGSRPERSRRVVGRGRLDADTRHAGASARAASADPDSSPPPPHGTSSRSSGPTSSMSSRAAVPCAGDDVRVVVGRDDGQARARDADAPSDRLAILAVAVVRHDLARRSASVAARFTAGASVGHDDDARDAEDLAGERHRLRVVARRKRQRRRAAARRRSAATARCRRRGT